MGTILRKYENCSGQCVNYDKLIVYFSFNTLKGERQVVSDIPGVQSSSDPKRYFGLPNMVGRNKRASFHVLKDRFKRHIDNWSVRLLS